MKTYIDFFETLKGEMLGAKRFRNKFYRLWGTETVDGVHVMKERFTIYPGHTSNKDIQRMCKLLGIWSDVKEANFRPIAGYYLWLNPNKNSSGQEDLQAELMAEKIDAYCAVDEWRYATINYVDKSTPDRFNGWTKEQILEYIDNDYRNIFNSDNGFIAADTLVDSAIGKYVLFDDGTEFEVEVLSSSIAPHTIETIDYPGLRFTRVGATKYYTALSIDIRFKRIVNDIDPDGVLMTAILAEQNEYELKLLAALQRSEANSSDEGGNFFDKEPIVTNDIWYKNQLRVSAIKAVGIRPRDILTTVLGTIDTGQIKKKVKWYKRILGFVLIVIAIVIAVATAGAGASLSAVLTAIAIAVGVAVLTMTLIQAQWAKKNAAAAEYMGRWVKIGNFVSLVSGIGAIIANIGRMVAQEALKQTVQKSLIETGKMSATEAAKAAAMMSATELAAYSAGAGLSTSLMAGLTAGVSNLTVSSAIEGIKTYITKNLFSIGMRIAEFSIKMRQDHMANDLEDKRQYADELAEQLTEADDRNLNISLEDMKVYAEPINMLRGRYDYDFPYEKEMSRIHIGNIQRSSYAKIGLNEISKDLA